MLGWSLWTASLPAHLSWPGKVSCLRADDWIWVWVKSLGTPKFWMVNTKLDFHICGPTSVFHFDPHPYFFRILKYLTWYGSAAFKFLNDVCWICWSTIYCWLHHGWYDEAWSILLPDTMLECCWHFAMVPQPKYAPCASQRLCSCKS